MFDNMNKLPTDPEWLKKVIEQAGIAAKELECMVLLVAIQEGGKLAVEASGIPEAGPLSELAKDPAGMLALLAYISMEQDHRLKKREH